MRLHPFCIGHALLLQRLGNAIVSLFSRDPGGPAPAMGRGDVLVAAWVCSRPYSEAIAGLDSWRMLRWLDFKRVTRALYAAEDQLALCKYLAAAHEAPPVRVIEQNDGKPSGAPWLAILIDVLMHRYHYSASAALECPYATAEWLHAISLAREGVITLGTEADAEFDAAAEAARAEAGADPATVLARVNQARQAAGLPVEETPL